MRAARAADAPRIADLLAGAFAEFERQFTPAAFEVVRPHAAEIAGRLAEGPVWVAVRNRAIVGTVSAVEHRAGVYFRSLAVAPSARGAGVARLLLDAIETWARSRRHRRLHLTTAPFMAEAIRLYERAGFVPGSEPPEDLCGTMLVPMEKHIA